MESKSETWAGHGQRISALQLLFNLWLTNNPNNQPNQLYHCNPFARHSTTNLLPQSGIGTTIEYWLSFDCKPGWFGQWNSLDSMVIGDLQRITSSRGDPIISNSQHMCVT